MPKVSVIVPCLNMRRYIENCLDSIVNQTLKELEVLVVDAGSADGTLDVLEEYVKVDERVHLIHSAKKSYGYQVNLGMESAAGEYIAIVDADDRISVNMYAALYEKAIQSKADYVKGTARGFCTISESLTYYHPLIQFQNEEYVNGEIELIPAERPDLLTRDNFLWYGIFRRDFMKDIRLHESPGAAFQDLGGLLQTQMKAHKAVYLQSPFYEYRQDNTLASEYNPKGFQFVWEEYTWAERFVGNVSAEWKSAFYRKFFMHAANRYSAMAAYGGYWEDAEPYICLIREKLKTAVECGIIGEEHFSGEEWENLQLFFSDEKKLYDKYFKMYLPKKQQLMNIQKTAVNREIVIFGYGNLGTFIHAQILKRGWNSVVAYCDNQAMKQGLLFWEVPILKPMDAVRLYPDACFVIASQSYFGDMEKQLISLGVSVKRICCYKAGVDMRLFGVI